MGKSSIRKIIEQFYCDHFGLFIQSLLAHNWSQCSETHLPQGLKSILKNSNDGAPKEAELAVLEG